MRTVGLIPARAGSKRVPGKNYRYCAGKPLIWWTIEAAVKSRLDGFYISTDSDTIRDICDGLPIVDRPAHLAADDTPSLDVILHALERIKCDRLMLLQPTSPLRTAEHINDVLDLGTTCVTVTTGDRTLVRNGAIYLMDADKPMEFQVQYFMHPDVSVDIDTEDDFALAERLLLR